MHSSDKARRWAKQVSPWVPALCFAVLALILTFFLSRLSAKKDPDGTAIAALAAFLVASVILAVAGRDILRRLKKISTEGIELQDAAETHSVSLEDARHDLGADIHDQGKKVSSRERWLFEKYSTALLGTSPKDLEDQEADDYRRTAFPVAAIARRLIGQEHKVLEMLRPIEELTHKFKDLSYDERHAIASAYYFAAVDERGIARDEDTGDDRRQVYQSTSTLLFVQARERFETLITEDRADASAHFALGWIFDELEYFDAAIAHDREAIRLAPEEYGTYGHQNMAVSYLKKGQNEEAIARLWLIQSGKHWQDIWTDKELEPLRNDSQFGPQFKALYDARISGVEPAWLCPDG